MFQRCELENSKLDKKKVKVQKRIDSQYKVSLILALMHLINT